MTILQIEDKNLVLDGKLFNIKGINWNPIPIGVNQDEKTRSYFDEYVDLDGLLMEDLGVNLVRTYEPILDLAVLDKLLERNIYVMSPIYIDADIDVNFAVTDTIEKTKSHPAVLMWYIGNEWNYNNLYASKSFDECVDLINQAAEIAKKLDTRPVATIYGELPTTSLVNRMPLIDVWGLNVYRGISFDNLFQDWESISNKPMFIGEYGADAYNSLIDSEDQVSQADATTKLTQIIFNESTISGGSCSGGIIFELADEWWKAGNDFTHDIGGIAPGGGPHPDLTFNEEWWGLVDIERKPRKAFFAFKDVSNPVASEEASNSISALALTLPVLVICVLVFLGSIVLLKSRKQKKAPEGLPVMASL